ncbi:MAG: hypothetical protein E7171_03305 [Firmicutes bacterium]|nr:hypothetical protein [Bacillota bacterium]
MKNKRFKIMVILFFIGFIVALGVSYSVDMSKSKDGVFNVKYDSTWKLVSKGEFTLKHKKTGSIISIQSKILEDNYVDTELKYLIQDIMYSIEEQNKDYKLINISDDVDSKYEAYSYLYEKDMEQVLVNVYKKGNKLIIAYYQADSEVYDIVLDSVDTILDSLVIS